MDRLRMKMNVFVGQLTPDECREQLVLAYLQMERCQQVLRGEDVEPVYMLDNGLSSDLELFYQCKKVADELSNLNEIASERDERSEKLSNLLYKDKERFLKELDVYPSKETLEKIRRGALEWKGSSKKIEYILGNDVYYWNGTIRKCKLAGVEYTSEHGWAFTLSDGTVLRGLTGVFTSKEDLVENLRKSTDGEES